MTHPAPTRTLATATVTDVLPATGLAYLTDDDQRRWTITKSTHGIGLACLQPGSRVDLTIIHHPGFALVSEYAAHH